MQAGFCVGSLLFDICSRNKFSYRGFSFYVPRGSRRTVREAVRKSGPFPSILSPSDPHGDFYPGQGVKTAGHGEGLGHLRDRLSRNPTVRPSERAQNSNVLKIIYIVERAVLAQFRVAPFLWRPLTKNLGNSCTRTVTLRQSCSELRQRDLIA